ncbi:chitotriosidase-1 [Rhipicephalus sanguineus]|uniref:chitotriosidase-1 n=1 Tax=Rhipicephalus sanguineus TaxID=34632 RepID=UPI0020C44EC5|nr:chitotriosidase-1 [Rhipicephalus sanguineus]
MPRTHHRMLPKRTRGRPQVESSYVDTTTVPETDVYDFDGTSDSSRCRAGDGDDDLLRSQPTTIDTHFTTVATMGTHDPPQRRVLELQSQLEDSADQPGTVHGEGCLARLASLAATLREQLQFGSRVHDVRPTVLSWRDGLASFARRNNTNLFTTFVAVTTVFLLLPLCVLYYKAGTMAAGMHQKGLLFTDDGRSIQSGFDTSTCKDFHPLVDGRPVHATPPSVDTEGFVPYRTKVVSTNPIFCVYQHDVFLRFPKLHYRVVDVPGAFCTHLIYHAAGVTADGSIYSKDPTFDETYQGFRQAAELKGVYTHLKVLLSLGGGPDERDTFQFSSMSGHLNRTRAFADKAYWWLVNRGFDGLHLDWRQPGGHCGSQADKQNFLVLVETLRERFGLRYIITVGVPYQEEYRHRGYHLPGIADQADFLLATTHGFHDASEKYAQCPSPYTTPNGPTMREVMRMLKYEVPREHRQRLCFSVSLMGHRWTLRSSGAFHAGSAASRAGPAAGDSQARGVLEYPLVCQYLLRDSVDPDGMCSYAVRFRDWVAYEGVHSLPLKLSRMRRDMGTPGLCVAVWDLAFDDFRGDCGNSRSPLLRTIHRALSSKKVWVIPKGAAGGKRP